MQLKGKSIFITGGTGGIGRPLVALLKKAGASVTVYLRPPDGSLGDELDRVCADLSKNAPDILINLAGYNVFSRCEAQDCKDILDINLLAPIRLIQAVLPAMRRRKSGVIVTIGSMTALIPLPHMTCYVASKAGLKAFADALRREVQGSGIVVTHVTPRAVNTGANKGLKAELNAKTGVTHDAPEYVAKRIVKAIINDEHDVRIGWPERFFAVLNSLIPALIDRALLKNRDIGESILTAAQKH